MLDYYYFYDKYSTGLIYSNVGLFLNNMYINKVHDFLSTLILFINKKINFLYQCKQSSLFLIKILSDICLTDTPGKKFRFTIYYTLLSDLYLKRVIIVEQINEILSLTSFIILYKNSQWIEREMWDLYGIFIIGNTDLRRLLTDYGFKGHALRKDFPLTGFVEQAYDIYGKTILYQPVELTQTYRQFYYNLMWIRE